jgi:predicted nucleotidyltransferase
LKVHGTARTQLYALDESHPFSTAIAALFQEEHERWEYLLTALQEMLAKRGAAVRAAWLYGSVARGDDTPRSDLDIALLVTSQKVADQVREGLMPLEDDHQVHAP